MHQAFSGLRSPYIGRFAPTPSGPLHFGSLVTAMASWLDARLVDGTWLVRIEDLDTPRNVPGADQDILDTLARYGMVADKAVTWQSQSLPDYWQALEQLQSAGLMYRCNCTRREIAESQTAGSGVAIYPGTCRDRGLLSAERGAWRVRTDASPICFSDRGYGKVCQQLGQEVGDFVLRRADGIVTYQLAVVVDDARAGVTHVVRGADLLDSTTRQIFLQRCLRLPTLRYWHVPVVVNDLGEKLSKQTGATALPRSPDEVVSCLQAAARHLGLGEITATSRDRFWRQALLRFCDQQAERALARHPHEDHIVE